MHDLSRQDRPALPFFIPHAPLLLKASKLNRTTLTQLPPSTPTHLPPRTRCGSEDAAVHLAPSAMRHRRSSFGGAVSVERAPACRRNRSRRCRTRRDGAGGGVMLMRDRKMVMMMGCRHRRCRR